MEPDAVSVRNPCLDPRVGDKKLWTERAGTWKRAMIVTAAFPYSLWPVRVQVDAGAERDLFYREWRDRGPDNDAEWIVGG